jgi:hypothetical protein
MRTRSPATEGNRIISEETVDKYVTRRMARETAEPAVHSADGVRAESSCLEGGTGTADSREEGANIM